MAAPPIESDLAAPEWPTRYNVIGSPVSATTYEEAVACIIAAAQERTPAIVSCQAVHAVVSSATDPVLLEKVKQFDMICPDGQPVRWALKWLHGIRLKERVYGPELTLRLCRAAATAAVPIYLYGSTEGTLQSLEQNLVADIPGLQIVGSYSPPFRKLTDEENQECIDRINNSGAGLVFIGLGCPKQDHFAADHLGQIQAVQVCVGAAFDFHAGKLSMAPAWMQRNGLEWLFRLVMEPRRLARRYFTTNSIFVYRLCRQLMSRNRYA